MHLRPRESSFFKLDADIRYKLNRSDSIRLVLPCASLHLAAHLGFHRVAGWLITTFSQDVNASYGSYCNTPLHIASGKGRFMVVQVLLEHFASVNARNINVWTPLHMASWHGYPNIARVLLEHEANVNLKNETGMTPLWLLSETRRSHKCCLSTVQIRMFGP